MNKLLTEFIGTFFLVLTVVTSAVFGLGGDLAPVAIGLSLAVMIYAGGHISGAHYNPAVTLGVFVRGRCSAANAIGYIVAQVLGGVGAATLAKTVFNVKGAAMEALPYTNQTAILVAEALFTFALVYVVLNTATAKANNGNSFYGAAIGLTVTVGAIAVGSISGGVFNPAVGAALFSIGKLSVAAIAPYIGAQLVGGLVAGIIFKVCNPNDK